MDDVRGGAVGISGGSGFLKGGGTAAACGGGEADGPEETEIAVADETNGILVCFLRLGIGGGKENSIPSFAVSSGFGKSIACAGVGCGVARGSTPIDTSEMSGLEAPRGAGMIFICRIAS